MRKKLVPKKVEKIGEKDLLKKERQKRGRNSRLKGGSYERIVAKKFGEELLVELVRTPQSGGFVKNSKNADGFRGDVIPVDKNVNFHLHIECKNTKTWQLPSWLKQAESDCPESRVPLVVFHKHNSSKDYVCLQLEDFLHLIDNQKCLEIKE